MKIALRCLSLIFLILLGISVGFVCGYYQCFNDRCDFELRYHELLYDQLQHNQLMSLNNALRYGISDDAENLRHWQRTPRFIVWESNTSLAESANAIQKADSIVGSPMPKNTP
jgi:hypothetical protein